MRRIRMIVEYDGTAYSGWQRQANAVSVQEKLEEALRKLTGEKELFVVGASRTDAGVHAFSQNVHFDTNCRIPADKFAYALPALLPEDIRVRASFRVRDDFHARFHAKRKQYRYVFYNSPHASAMYRNLSAHVMYPLDEEAMNREVKSMIGTHDFAPFAASGSEVKDTTRTIYSAGVKRDGDFVVLTVEGNGFLYNMVRILAGTLIHVGCGKLEKGAIARALTSMSRLDLGVTAPARGLTLMRIDYENGDAVEDVL
ncbi:MAG: tRNA pseudouridine(38-40) synthase TruA [Clostridia bacterium]|nr:tRNA pseudouridine(38-40) synthase TruA [Clostridia bacterium]MBQ4158009.1 tRNA pseudouridine(38-40) synthase TruA [Clostridia bacterium]